MTNSQVIIISVIIFLTLLNFLLWSKTNYGTFSPHLKQVYTDVLARNDDQNLDMNRKLGEIQKKIDQILKEKVKSKEGFEELFENMKNFSTSQISIRQNVLSKIRTPDQYYDLYGSLASEVFCPQKVRVGTVGDGGKWVCNPWNVPRDSVLFSLGLNNFIGFEQEWQNITDNGNVLYGFDVDEQSESTKAAYSKIRGTPRKAKISPKTDASLDQFTIEDLTRKANITKIEILKIDIEGAELNCLVPFLEKYQVCQIYLEVHGGAQEHAKLLREISHLGYRLFSYEVNGYAMSACEYSFIHESCVEKYGAMGIAKFLDF